MVETKKLAKASFFVSTCFFTNTLAGQFLDLPATAVIRRKGITAGFMWNRVAPDLADESLAQ
jgi:hypothetical protein